MRSSILQRDPGIDLRRSLLLLSLEQCHICRELLELLVEAGKVGLHLSNWVSQKKSLCLRALWTGGNGMVSEQYVSGSLRNPPVFLMFVRQDQ